MEQFEPPMTSDPVPATASCEQDVLESSLGTNDAMVCYCFRFTTRMIKEAYARCGSLKALEDETGIGSACAGCKVVLQSLFNEIPSDINNIHAPLAQGTACSKPGQRTMKGFIIANDEIESRIVSANTVAPQLGKCDATVPVEYALVDHRGQQILHRSLTIPTNGIFTFDTREEDLPRPFLGMFLFGLGRSNFGAARFNIYWSNRFSSTSTHENGDTGRCRVFLPLIAREEFLRGPNLLYLGIMNPHLETIPMIFEAKELESGETIRWSTSLGPLNSNWIDVNQTLLEPAFKRFPGRRVIVKIESSNLNPSRAATVYFFFYNRNTRTWSSNHL